LRAVLDPEVLISVLLSRSGAPGRLLARWLAGDFELVISHGLVQELRPALDCPKLRARIAPNDADRFVELLCGAAERIADHPDPPRRSVDRGDDYLIALAAAASAALVGGDRHLLELARGCPCTRRGTSTG
jgi:putative PIN family toxin of toxin-antitoxin system